MQKVYFIPHDYDWKNVSSITSFYVTDTLIGVYNKKAYEVTLKKWEVLYTLDHYNSYYTIGLYENYFCNHHFIFVGKSADADKLATESIANLEKLTNDFFRDRAKPINNDIAKRETQEKIKELEREIAKLKNNLKVKK